LFISSFSHPLNLTGNGEDKTARLIYGEVYTHRSRKRNNSCGILLGIGIAEFRSTKISRRKSLKEQRVKG
jgi:hypothetical protein